MANTQGLNSNELAYFKQVYQGFLDFQTDKTGKVGVPQLPAKTGLYYQDEPQEMIFKRARAAAAETAVLMATSREAYDNYSKHFGKVDPATGKRSSGLLDTNKDGELDSGYALIPGGDKATIAPQSQALLDYKNSLAFGGAVDQVIAKFNANQKALPKDLEPIHSVITDAMNKEHPNTITTAGGFIHNYKDGVTGGITSRLNAAIGEGESLPFNTSFVVPTAQAAAPAKPTPEIPKVPVTPTTATPAPSKAATPVGIMGSDPVAYASQELFGGQLTGPLLTAGVKRQAVSKAYAEASKATAHGTPEEVMGKLYDQHVKATGVEKETIGLAITQAQRTIEVAHAQRNFGAGLPELTAGNFAAYQKTALDTAKTLSVAQHAAEKAAKEAEHAKSVLPIKGADPMHAAMADIFGDPIGTNAKIPNYEKWGNKEAGIKQLSEDAAGLYSEAGRGSAGHKETMGKLYQNFINAGADVVKRGEAEAAIVLASRVNDIYVAQHATPARTEVAAITDYVKYRDEAIANAKLAHGGKAMHEPAVPEAPAKAEPAPAEGTKPKPERRLYNGPAEGTREFTKNDAGDDVYKTQQDDTLYRIVKDNKPLVERAKKIFGVESDHDAILATAASLAFINDLKTVDATPCCGQVLVMPNEEDLKLANTAMKAGILNDGKIEYKSEMKGKKIEEVFAPATPNVVKNSNVIQ